LGGDPERVGPYQVLGRLGAGGMGTVFLARCGDGPPVAVKVLRPELSRDPSFLRLFRHEVDAARRVVGFCTARVLDADLSGPLPYLVTEYVEGVRLDRAVAGSGGLAATDLEGLAVGMAAAAAGRWLPEPAALPRAMDDHEFRGGCTRTWAEPGGPVVAALFQFPSRTQARAMRSQLRGALGARGVRPDRVPQVTGGELCRLQVGGGSGQLVMFACNDRVLQIHVDTTAATPDPLLVHLAPGAHRKLHQSTGCPL
jgi:hypothetical protein